MDFQFESQCQFRFQFRINGIVITHLGVRPAVVDGYPTEQSEIVAYGDTLGWFVIDDNPDLADPVLPRFVLEVRDLSIPPIEHRFLPNNGWKQMTTTECISLLESAGLIDKL